MTKKSTFIQKIALAFFLMLASQAMLAQNICDCDGTSHTPGVLDWIGDTFADDGAYTWEGQPVNFNCATWGYDCGDIAGAPTDDPYGVCSGNLPPFNGCSPNDILGCTDPLALNYNIDATVDDGSCIYPTICDCAGTEHTIGVLDWIGDTYADDGAFQWEGQFVDFNCATWGYDCGDIVGAPVDDPYSVCLGQLPPNNGCGLVVFGCTDPAANNYNPDATADDGSCMYDIAGCTDPAANNYDPMATIEDGSCTYGACTNLNLSAFQMPCTPNANDVLNPAVDFVFDFTGTCTVAELIINLDGTEYPFAVAAPDNVSGSVFSLVGFPSNVAFSAYYTLTDGTPSDVFDFTVGDCSQDAVICDCDGNQHTIGVLSWLGDTYADNAAYTWAGVTVNFNCATWGYDCGDIAGAPAEDPYDVCGGNLPPNNGCSTTDVFGCTDPAANNYNPDATADDGSCMYDIAGCTDPAANNYDPMATIEDGSCTYGACTNLNLSAFQMPCTPNANDVLNPAVDFVFDFAGECTVAELIINLDGTEYPFAVAAPDNVSGSVFSLVGFPSNVAFSAYYTLNDGTPSDVFDFTVGDCSQDAVICDCDGNQHTIGVLSWLGDTYADNGAYTWAGVTVNLNCATWGYDCGDIAGAPAEDPYDVCGGNLPPNNGCSTTDVFGCTDPSASNYNAAATIDDGSCVYDIYGCTDATANNYNPSATINDGSCTYDIYGCTDQAAVNYNPSATIDDGSCVFPVYGCTDPFASNYNPDANVNDGSCLYDGCVNLMMEAIQTPCTQDNTGALNPGVDFVFVYSGTCTVSSININLGGTDYPFDVVAPDNVSGSVFGLVGFPANATFTASYVLSDGTQSAAYEFTIGDCSQDPIICDCDGNQHTIGVLSWLGDTYADNAAYTWGGATVNFECATWGYDCGDIVGAPAEDPYGVCDGNLPPNNGCSTTSVEEVASVSFEAYPNPTSGMLTLVNRGEGGSKQIRVFDQTGKLQFAEQRSMNAGASEQFNLSNLAAGTYHVQVVGSNGVSNITVIVQK